MHFRKSKNSVAGVWMSVLENTALCLPWFVSILMSELRYETGRLTLRQLSSGLLTSRYVCTSWACEGLWCWNIFSLKGFERFMYERTQMFSGNRIIFLLIYYEVKTSRWALTSETVQVLSIAAREAIDLVFREQGISLPAVTHSSEKQPWLYGENADFPVFKWMKS